MATPLPDPNAGERTRLTIEIADLQAQLPDAERKDAANAETIKDAVNKQLQARQEEQNAINELRQEGEAEGDDSKIQEANQRQTALNWKTVGGAILDGAAYGLTTNNAEQLHQKITEDENKLAGMN